MHYPFLEEDGNVKIPAGLLPKACQPFVKTFKWFQKLNSCILNAEISW